MILADHDTLTAEDFALRTASVSTQPESLNLEENERRLVATALADTDGNISHAAEALGITRAALYRRIEKFGL